ncbi:hypothetical protein AVEN_261633-1 [Araneus ventricosus]|uniref:Uncharacterized protein n=1 Tax=Araneus ventricosus TaxID=182803 RepID=A0A4Y2P8B0_ARAVE|nr:hypothetical protein AVEN_261633-1 [Araneus ventricosus]
MTQGRCNNLAPPLKLQRHQSGRLATTILACITADIQWNRVSRPGISRPKPRPLLPGLCLPSLILEDRDKERDNVTMRLRRYDKTLSIFVIEIEEASTDMYAWREGS